MEYETNLVPESIGPNAKSRAQLANCLSQAKSRNFITRRHVRSHSNESVISIGRRMIGTWNSDDPFYAENSEGQDQDATGHRRNLVAPIDLVDYIAHLTHSNTLLKERKGEVMYEKRRFHDLGVRIRLSNQSLEFEKQISAINVTIAEKSKYITELTNELELKMRKKDCLDILFGELLFQIQHFSSRQIEVDKINAAISQAQAAAAKKAKINRLTGIKGVMQNGVMGSSFGVNRVRSSRSAGLNTRRDSQYLENARTLSKYAINISSRINIFNSEKQT